MPWERGHAEAEKIEHVLSEDLEARMDAALGHPVVDPHGAPIPTHDLQIAESDAVPLATMSAGEHGSVAEVSDHDADLLRYVGELGLYPQTSLEVVAVAPFDGPFTVRVGGDERTVGRKAAHYIFVTRKQEA